MYVLFGHIDRSFNFLKNCVSHSTFVRAILGRRTAQTCHEEDSVFGGTAEAMTRLLEPFGFAVQK
jgi:hypothetical protein